MLIPHQRGTIDPSRSREGDSRQSGPFPKLAKSLANVGFPAWQLAGAWHAFSLPECGQKKHENSSCWGANFLAIVFANGEPSAQKAEVAAPARRDGGGQGFGSYLLPSSASAVRRAPESKDSPPASGAEGRTGQGKHGLASMSVAAEPIPSSAPVLRQRSKPLIPLRGVVALLGKSKDEVLELIDGGGLLWAWDVALSPKDGRKRELRILPAAVADFLSGRPCSLEWADVCRLLLPHDEPVILSSDISRVLNVSVTHLYDLARRKVLAPCSPWRKGPGGQAKFPTKSVVDFLKSRRVL